ncbi:hypothetical protein LP414_04240 [Polaromonas sp. P1(28)-13]|nr:hypothetical protein LP414_04240 [Polaromonas sp. P1(28)-13]
MLPPLTDFVALLGIDLVLCAGCLRLLSWRRGVTPWAKWGTAVCFVLLWCPVAAAHLPIVPYVRGISSDLSITLVVLASLGLCQRLFGFRAIEQRERMVVNAALAAAAFFCIRSRWAGATGMLTVWAGARPTCGGAVRPVADLLGQRAPASAAAGGAGFAGMGCRAA